LDVPLDLTWKRIRKDLGGITLLEDRAQGIAMTSDRAGTHGL
jgi:hypothetical protein